MKDQPTLDFYAREAEAYATRYRVSEELGPFLALVPAGGRILELGCGGGQDSEAMLAAGFDAIPTDGSAELAREAEKRLDRRVEVLLFEDIDFVNEFDGIWANACLLHAPKSSLPTIFENIHKALRSGGVLYASFKTGGEERIDQFGRYYNYPDEAYLRQALEFGNWSSVEISQREGSGYYNLPAIWLHVLAIKA
ncbi:class I SAM-dependent methyltransferase [Mesorhizobium sp. UC22_110]|uniref:class I SAM-dependent methyltransferase n=1 Tax=unclassified Mesorhizobium TaxID=325217 RepID=UPI00366E9D6C